MIADGILHDNNNTEELQQANAVLASTNNDIMQQLQQITAQLGAIRSNNNPLLHRDTN